MKISEQQFRELLDRYLTNTASASEREILDRFFDSYHSGLSDPAFLKKHPEIQQEILRDIHSRIGQGSASHNRSWLWLPLAAVISVFALAWFFLDGDVLPRNGRRTTLKVIEEKTTAGEKLSVRLPDGSSVLLNGDSEISYPEVFGEDVREVTVAGEAYFDVVKNTHPFIVHANQIRTEVLGTSFNVKSRKGKSVEVTLVEGKVNVISRSGRSVVLKPSQQAVIEINSGDVSSREVDILPYTSWKDNILFFEKMNLKEAVASVELWYGVKIQIMNPSLEHCVITGKYHDEPLGNVLSSFQFLLDLKIERLGEQQYAISGKGCK
jgi:transmembrane sensor